MEGTCKKHFSSNNSHEALQLDVNLESQSCNTIFGTENDLKMLEKKY